MFEEERPAWLGSLAQQWYCSSKTQQLSKILICLIEYQGKYQIRSHLNSILSYSCRMCYWNINSYFKPPLRICTCRMLASTKLKQTIYTFSLLTLSGCISPFTTHVTGLHNKYDIYYIYSFVPQRMLMFSKMSVSPTHMSMHSWRQSSRWGRPRCSSRLCFLPLPLGKPEEVWQQLPWRSTSWGCPAEEALSDQAAIQCGM